MAELRVSRRVRLEGDTVSGKKNTIDLDVLAPETRRLVEKAIGRRDSQFASRFRKVDIEAWHKAAASSGETITDWVERNLNRAAARAKSE